MCNRLTIATAVLVVASAGVAMGQQPPAAPHAPTVTIGSMEFGGRVSTVDGDKARFERFRDLRDGALSRIVFGKETPESATRLLVQNNTPGVVGVPGNVAQLATGSIYRSLAKPFDIQARRDVAGLTASFASSKDLTFNFSFNSTARNGHEPKGASFGFSVADQLPVPLDNRTNDFSAAAEWTKPEGMVRVAWDGSWFHNNIHELLFDNPVRATDTSPIDFSGYSNGRGAARSRMSVPPSNNLNTVSAIGLYKMPAHSAVNAQLSFTTMRQNDTLIPWTSNAVIASPAVYKNFPGLASLPRNTAEAEVRGVNALVNYTTRPTRFFGLTMRYRYNDRQNRTPTFDAREYVRLDAVPEETGGETEPFNIRQNTLDVNGLFNVTSRTSIRLGYTLDDFKRTSRELSGSTDYTFRTTVDTVGNQYLMVRLIYEHSERVGTGLSVELLEEAGFQPGLRTYDIADRVRDRGWMAFTVTPVSLLDLSFAVAAGRDTFGGPGREFGLMDNKNTVYNFGINASPMPSVRVGANYGRDQYVSNQASRNASPAGTDYGTWFDPNRNWFLNNDEKVNIATIYLDLIKAIEKTDISVSYDYSDSNNAYIHSGPRIQELSTNKALSGPSAILYPGFTIPSPCAAGLTSCFEPLPAITNKWQRFMVDLKYMFAAKVGVGLGYWYEKFDISDYATVDVPGQPGTPRIDYLGEISTGYGNRPYKGNTGFFRILYFF
ncbi:MAG: MtrB/PioB family outer membrane beta-barrel protein [Acidobacteria bacterium]|nr:MtrB/PioB family outer membrane beta-barrel protein [Acidobacteriota bacterium]